MYELALFAGAGGGILGGKLIGWQTVCAVEINPYARCVLASRQNDGSLPAFPIWDDICSFDGKPWQGCIDVVSGGFPCQDISIAGKGIGITGERSGLWKEMSRIIGEVKPKFVLVENSPMLRTKGLDVVIQDLAALGYVSQWCIVSARDVKAPHKRDRLWLLGYSDNNGQLASEVFRSITQGSNNNSPREKQASQPKRSGFKYKKLADSNGTQCKRWKLSKRIKKKYSKSCGTSWWDIEPELGRVANGVACRVDRLKAIGNGQVPAVAATAFNILKNNK